MKYSLQDKTVLITGGTGSLGSKLVERLLIEPFMPKKIIVFSRDELKQHNMRLHYMRKPSATDEIIYDNFNNVVTFRIGDLRDYHSVVNVLKGVDVVINTAAIKQIPVAEYNPLEAIKTNVLGVQNIIDAITEFRLPVETVIGISSDKACKPINAYGMTKAIMERMMIAANLNSETRYVLCRYGNVMGSRGSVIPLFKEQVGRGHVITLTTRDMTRFMMNLDQAVDTVFTTYVYGMPGDIYVPKVRSSLIEHVAIAIRRGVNIPITVTGIRPGEKVHEVLVSAEEMTNTGMTVGGEYYMIHPSLPELHKFGHTESERKEYSSATHVMTFDETKQLLEREHFI